MNKKILFTSLMIMALGVTSCGRKKPEVEAKPPAAPGTDTLLLSASSSCEQAMAKDPAAPQSSALYVAKAVKTDKVDQKISKLAMDKYLQLEESPQKDAKVQTFMVHIKGDKIAKGAKKLPEYILAQVGAGQGQYEFFVNQNAKGDLSLFKTAFSNAKCIDLKTDKPTDGQTDEQKLAIAKAELTKLEASIAGQNTAIAAAKVKQEAAEQAVKDAKEEDKAAKVILADKAAEETAVLEDKLKVINKKITELKAAIKALKTEEE